MTSNEMKGLAQELRRTVLDMAWSAGSGHIGGSFSCAEIMTVLYNGVMNIDPADPNKKDRDVFILSKGHGAPSLYFTLARKGFFDEKQLKSFRQFGSVLQGHPDMHKVPGVEISTGSLGMGISNGIRAQRLSVALQCGLHTPRQAGISPAHNQPDCHPDSICQSRRSRQSFADRARKVLWVASCYNGPLFHNHRATPCATNFAGRILSHCRCRRSGLTMSDMQC